MEGWGEVEVEDDLREEREGEEGLERVGLDWVMTLRAGGVFRGT